MIQDQCKLMQRSENGQYPPIKHYYSPNERSKY